MSSPRIRRGFVLDPKKRTDRRMGTGQQEGDDLVEEGQLILLPLPDRVVGFNELEVASAALVAILSGKPLTLLLSSPSETAGSHHETGASFGTAYPGRIRERCDTTSCKERVTRMQSSGARPRTRVRCGYLPPCDIYRYLPERPTSRDTQRSRFIVACSAHARWITQMHDNAWRTDGYNRTREVETWTATRPCQPVGLLRRK